MPARVSKERRISVTARAGSTGISVGMFRVANWRDPSIRSALRIIPLQAGIMLHPRSAAEGEHRIKHAPQAEVDLGCMELRCNPASSERLAPTPPGFLPLSGTMTALRQSSTTARRSSAGWSMMPACGRAGNGQPAEHTHAKVGRARIRRSGIPNSPGSGPGTR